MNNEKTPKPPTLLLLILLAVCCGLLLMNTLSENVASGGMQSLQSKNLDLEQAVEKTVQ